MSDESSEPSDDAGLEPFGDDELLYNDVAAPALAGRIEGVHGSISTLGMRIDALVSSTTAYRSSLTDRLAEYSDLVAKLTRAQATDLDEYRRANERTLAELRRSLSVSESTLERLSARVDELLADAESGDDKARKLAADVRAVIDSQDRMGSFVTDALDQFGERVLERIGTTQRDMTAGLEAVRTALVTGQEATNDLAEKITAPVLRQSIDELRGDVQGLRRAVLEWPELTHTKEQVNAARNDLAVLLERVAALPDDASVGRLQQDIREVVGTVGSLADDASVREAIAAVQASVDGLDPAAAIEEAMTGLVERLESFDPAAPIDAAMGRLDAQIAASVARIDELDIEGAIVGSLEAVEAKLAPLATDETLEGAVARLESRIAPKATTEDLSSGLAQLMSRVDALAGGLEAMWSDTSTIDDLGNRIDGLAGGLEAMWSDTSVADRLRSFDEKLTALGNTDFAKPLAGVIDQFEAVRRSADGAASAEQVETLGTTVDHRLGSIQDQVVGTSNMLASVRDELAGMRALAEAADAEDLDDAEPEIDLRAVVDSVERRLDQMVEVSRSILREELGDVASGAVVGSLYDEVRQLHDDVATVGTSVRAMRGELADGVVVEPSEALVGAVAALQQQITDFQARLDAADEADADTVEPGPSLDETLAELRMVIEQRTVAPDRLDAALGVVRSDLAGLVGQVEALAAVAGDLVARADAEAVDAHEIDQDEPEVDDDWADSPVAEAFDPDELTEQVRAVVQLARDEVLSAVAELRAVSVEASSSESPVQQVVELARDEVLSAVAELRAVSVEASSSESPVQQVVELARDEVLSAVAELRAVSVEASSSESPVQQVVELARDEVLSAVAELRAVSVEASSSESPVQQVVELARDEVLSAVAELRAVSVEASSSESPVPGAVDGARDEVLAAVEELRTAIAEQPAPPPGPGADMVSTDELVDQLAGLRDLLVGEFDGMRQALAVLGEGDGDPAEVGEQLGLVRNDLAEIRSAVAAVDTGGAGTDAHIDPALVESLRADIRASGGIADDVLDQLRQELRALRRRISLRASQDVFSEEQLDAIAAAIAERLG